MSLRTVGPEDRVTPTAEPEPSQALKARGRRWTGVKAREVFTADLRSLAALRIALAVVVLMDLAWRAADLTAHYTDAGVLPRADLLGNRSLLSHWTFSLNLISGGAFFQQILFALAALAAIGLLVGYATRLMTLLVWLLVVSIQWRNPLLIGGGEVLLRVLLFWSLFLPLGRVWSVDRARGRTPVPASIRVASVPVAALFLQIAFVYWFAVIQKSGPEWRFGGTALYDALSVDQLAKPLGHFLTHYPGLLTVMTFGVLAFEAFGPFLLLSPFLNSRTRTVGVFLFMGFHLGIWLTLGMGMFPAFAGGCMVCFLPSSFWDRLGVLFHRARGRAPAAATSGAVTPLRTPRTISLVTGALLVFVVVINLETVSALRMPEPLHRLGSLTGLSQSWNMFAPSPLRDDGWYVVPGTLRDGQTVDLAGVMRGDESVQPVSFERPRNIRATYKNEHWRKYLEGLRSSHADQTRYLIRYICREWNGNHGGGEAVTRMVVLYMGDPTLPDNRHVRPRPRTLGLDSCA